MATRTADTVDSPSLAYSRMAEKWRLIDDLCGGTQTMRAAQETWLPRETKERWSDYLVRLNRSVLYSALADTIDKTAARPFSKPVTLQDADSLPDALQGIEDDADQSGSTISMLARECFIDLLKYGKFHLLVDYPQAQPMRLSEYRQSGIKPYFCRISPRDLIGWRSERTTANADTLTQVRFRESRVEPEGMFGEQLVEYVRVLEPGRWELHRQEDGQYARVEEGTTSIQTIPLVTVYANRIALMESDPTFEDLAWLNLAHWQSYSDQRNLLRVARVPILAATGLSASEYDQGLTIGTANFLKSTTPEAKFFYVEHTGAALGAGEADLKTLEERMEVLGLQPLVSRAGGVTATAKSMDEARTESNIQAWIRATESGLYQAYGYAAEWIGAELSEDFSVDIYSDFSLTLKSADDLAALAAMHASGVITSETYLYEVKRRGVISEMVDVEEEAQKARDESPMPATPTFEPDMQEEKPAEEAA